MHQQLTDPTTFVEAIGKIRAAYEANVYPFSNLLALPFAKNYQTLLGTGTNNGNHNHFVNVVATAAHLLDYYDQEKHFSPDRKLKFLLTAFYHDIGKTICVNLDKNLFVTRRHAIEGASLFLEPRASVVSEFDAIFKFYQSDISARDYMNWSAELIQSHEMFGTVSTGENGYMSVAEAVSRLKDYGGDCQENVFNLWLLNIADILVSITVLNDAPQNKMEPNKYFLQPVGSQKGTIDWFFKTFQGRALLKDLEIAQTIASDSDPLKAAYNIASETALVRFQRLAQQTIGRESKALSDRELSGKIVRLVEGDSLSSEIARILRGEFGPDYKSKFGHMQQFDYALSFFSNLAKWAVKRIGEELDGSGFRTGWVYSQKYEHSTKRTYTPEFIAEYNASAIVSNFLLLQAGIFAEVSRLTGDIEQWNVEFGDANERLTESKKDKLLNFDGGYRSANARVNLMKEIMLYRG
jgi:hypothetical protein